MTQETEADETQNLEVPAQMYQQGTNTPVYKGGKKVGVVTIDTVHAELVDKNHLKIILEGDIEFYPEATIHL